MKKTTAAMIAIGTFALAGHAAEARPHHHHGQHHARHERHRQHLVRHERHRQYAWHVLRSSSDARPAAWCGWWMRHHLGIANPSLNLARNWAGFGTAAHGPAPGVIGVQRHHVFKVLAVVGRGKVLAISGNDGHAVRTRVRSTRSVIAWRTPA